VESKGFSADSLVGKAGATRSSGAPTAINSEEAQSGVEEDFSAVFRRMERSAELENPFRRR
jgi:hypothetical protein